MKSCQVLSTSIKTWWFGDLTKVMLHHLSSQYIINQVLIVLMCVATVKDSSMSSNSNRKKGKRTPKCDHLQHKLTIYCCAAWNSFVMSHKPNLISTQKRRMVMFRKLLDCQLFLCRPWRPVTMPDVIHHLEKWFSSWKRITWDP